MGNADRDVESGDRGRAGGGESTRRAELRFDLVVGGVTDYAIFLLDATGHVASWNAGAERIKGYEAPEIIGQHFSRFYPPEAVASGFPQHELEVADREGRFEDEGWRLRKDGSRFWANVVITALHAQNGELSGFLKITRDLTERKLSEETLRQSEERFRLLVEGVKDYAIFMLDPRGYVSSWNEGARRIKGYEASEIIGQHFSRFYPPEALAKNWPAFELEVAERDGRFEDEGWRVRKDGTEFWANVVITALHGGDGTLRGFAKVTRDLTQRKQVESLAEANRRMNEFLAMVSHELRTPLNSMLGWIRLLRAGRLDGEAAERGLATIERNTLAQAKLVEDLLDVSRIVTGKLRLAAEPVDLEPTIQSAVESVRLAADSKGVALEVAAEPDAGLVMGDRERLQQVIWNLLSNAIKFTPPGGRIRATLSRSGDLARLTVADTGQGIPQDFLPHVFDHFRQADASSTRKHGGLGLGLAIVKHLVEAHGGTVWAESQGEGQGASFVVTLPLIPAKREEGRQSAPGEDAGAGGGFGASLGGARVLVVEDEADTREMLEVVLGGSGAEVRSAGSTAEALALLDEWTPDVLVSDIGMPGQDGFELIRAVRARTAGRGGGVPAVALTAYARLEDRMRALHAGFQMHVAKPVEPAELVTVIHGLLALSGRQHAARDADPPV